MSEAHEEKERLEAEARRQEELLLQGTVSFFIFNIIMFDEIIL